MSNSDHHNDSFSKLRELVERFKLLVGMSSLGVATAILALSNRNRTRSPSPDLSLGLILMALNGALSFFLTSYRTENSSDRRQLTSRKRIRTG